MLQDQEPKSPSDDATELLDELRLMNLEMSEEKARLETIFQSRAEEVDRERDSVQRSVSLYESVVAQDRATEEDEVEYVLALKRRLDLDAEYADLREAVALLNLPAEADNLSGEVGEVDPSPEEVET